MWSLFRFLCSLIKFGEDISAATGDTVRRLVCRLLVSRSSSLAPWWVRMSGGDFRRWGGWWWWWWWGWGGCWWWCLQTDGLAIPDFQRQLQEVKSNSNQSSHHEQSSIGSNLESDAVQADASQKVTSFPVRPFVLPFLQSNIPLLRERIEKWENYYNC